LSEVSFRLSQEGLTAYQYAVRDRLQGRRREGFLAQPAVLWSMLTATVFGLTLAAMQAIERLLGRPMEMPEFLFGLIVGFAVMLATWWAYYLDQRRGLARPDGPILSPQTLRWSGEGVEVRSKACDVRYNWAAVEAITEARGLVILWVEPGAGLAIPAQAFGSDAARARFIAEAETMRSAAATATPAA
jgi:hypothetical protein